MKNKTLSWLSSFVLLIPSVFAAESFLDTLYELLGSIAALDLSKIGAATGVDVKALFLAKFLLWIIIFTGVYYALKFVFKEPDQNKFAVAISIAVSIGTVLVIPNLFILQLFQTYTAIAVVVLIGGPIFGVWLLTGKIKDTIGEAHPRVYHIVDAMLFWLIVVALKNVNTGLAREYNILQYTSWMSFAFAICEIMMFYHILAVFFVGGKGSLGAMKVGEIPGKIAEAAETYTPTAVRAARRAFKKSFRFEKYIVADLADAKKALLAKPPEIIEIVEKLGSANQRAENMLASAEFIKDLEQRADKVADAANKVNLKRKIDIHSRIIIKNVPLMQKEISAIGQVFAPLALAVQQAGPAGAKAILNKIPPKAIAEFGKRLDNAIKMGEQVENAIQNLVVLESDLENIFKV